MHNLAMTLFNSFKLRRIFIANIFLLTSVLFTVKAQKFEPFVSIGYGSFKMNRLKELHQYLPTTTPIEEKITDNFPNYLTYEIGVLIPFDSDKRKAGISFGQMSTGSRASLIDYSGSYTSKQCVNNLKYGLIYEHRLYKISNIGVSFNGTFSYTFTNYSFEESLIVKEEINEHTSFDMKSIGFSLEPRLKLTLPFNYLILSLQCGYYVDIPGNLNYKDKSSMDFRIKDNTVPTDFSGFRINLCLAIKLDEFLTKNHE